MSSLDENLILEVSKHELLYNAKSPAYSNRHKRDVAWQDIAKNLKSATGICQNVNQHWQIAI